MTHDESPSQVREALGLGGPLPETGTDPASCSSETARLLFDHSLLNGHPRFFGYITAPPAPIGILGDFLAAAVNPNVGAWMLSPAATEIESQTVRWIAELIGYPATAAAACWSAAATWRTSSASSAARTAKAPAGTCARKESGGERRRLRVYASAETHTWIQKAADLSGLGTAAIRWIPTDDDLRMDVAALRRSIDADAAGRRPPVHRRRHGGLGQHRRDRSAARDRRAVPRAWRVVPRRRRIRRLRGRGARSARRPARARRDADSVAVDPHKWLYAPLEAGCALVRDPEALRAAFAYHPPYYHFEERATNYVDYGPQNSRGFRALKVWLALQARRRGRLSPDDRRRHPAVARDGRGRPQRTPELEFVTQSLSITTFRFVPRDLRTRPGGRGRALP